MYQGRKVADVSFDADNIPSSTEKAALVGTSGTPGSGNKYVTDTDSRMTDARTPASHGNEAHSSTFITSTGVTYENLNTNGDVGQASSTVAAGDDNRFPTANEKAALGAAPNALTVSNPVADKTYVDNLIDGVEWYPSVNDEVLYVKATTGAPTGTPSVNAEKCLNTVDEILYQYNTGTGTWLGIQTGFTTERYVFKTGGTDTTGNSGTYTPTNKIYGYNGTAFEETTPTKGATFNFDPNGLDYRYDGTSAWIEKSSTTSHNNLTTLQGGTASQYYHTTQAQNEAIAGAASPSSTNVFQTYNDRKPFVLTWLYQGGFAASQTDVEPYGESGIFQRSLMPSNFRIVKTTYQSTAARSAGTLTVEPTIDGTKVTPSDLDITIDGTTTNDAYKSVAPSATGYNGTAGQKVGFKITSDASWLPITSDMELKMWIAFD